MRTLRTRFWIDSALAVASGLLCGLTLVWRDWIEGVFGVDPDRHSGSLEWLIVVGLAVAAAVLGLMARAEWRAWTMSPPARAAPPRR